MATKAELAEVWQVLAETYPDYVSKLGATQERSTFEIYCRLMVHIPIEAIRAAAVKHMQTSQWFPKPSELIQPALSMVLPEIPTAMEAWGTVLAQIAGVGYYGSPTFENEVTERVVKAMGWRNLCLSDNEPADRARFIQAYDQLAQRKQERDRMHPEVREFVERIHGPVQVSRLLEDVTRRLESGH